MAPNDKRHKFLKERTTLRTWFLAMIAAVLGIILLVLANVNNLWHGLGSVQSVIRDIGSLMVASVAISLILELGGKRAFLDELLSKVHLSKDFEVGGIVAFNPSFHRDIDWNSLFDTVRELDIFFVHGRAWRHEHGEKLLAIARRGIQIRIVLPDPDDDITISEIARRTRHSKENIKDRILLAKDEFYHLKTEGAKVNVWFLPMVPLFSFYRFDNKMIMSLYSHRQEQKLERIHVPAFILEESGSLYKFIQEDFEAMVDSQKGLAKPV